MVEEFTIEPMRCGYCNQVASEDLLHWTLTHRCEDMPIDLIVALERHCSARGLNADSEC